MINYVLKHFIIILNMNLFDLNAQIKSLKVQQIDIIFHIFAGKERLFEVLPL